MLKHNREVAKSLQKSGYRVLVPAVVLSLAVPAPAVAQPYNDLFIGTVEEAQGALVLVRCNLAATRYVLHNAAGAPDPLLALQALRKDHAKLQVELIASYRPDGDGHILEVSALGDVTPGKDCHLINAVDASLSSDPSVSHPAGNEQVYNQTVNEPDEFDPSGVTVTDAINCYLGVPEYNAFALSIAGDDGGADSRGWHKVESANAFLSEYELPEPVTVTGSWTTRRIAFSSSGILAILDVADPSVIAVPEGIANEMDPDPFVDAIVASGAANRSEVEAEIKFRKFLGQRVLVDETEFAQSPDGFGTHTVIARSISNVSSHPGKTLYGCAYRIELLDAQGKPL